MSRFSLTCFSPIAQKRVGVIMLVLLVSLLNACGGGSSDSSDTKGDGHQEDGQDVSGNESDQTKVPDFEFPSTDRKKLKPFLHGDLAFTTNHDAVQSTMAFSGVTPVLSLGKTSFLLWTKVRNGWANRYIRVTIKDADGIDGTYQCKQAVDSIATPVLSERDCFVHFENDSYVGLSEQWAVGEASCEIAVTNARLGTGHIYEDFDIQVSCQDMVNRFTRQDLFAVPAGADIESLLSIQGRIYSSEKSRESSGDAEFQTLTAVLSTVGGDGLMDSDITFESIGAGFSNTGGGYFSSWNTSDRQYSLSIYLNAAYNVKDTFNCVTKERLGLKPALYLEDGECLISIEKKSDSNIYNWSWDSVTGMGCTLQFIDARLTSDSYPLYDVVANINCPNMVSRAVSFGLRYPGGVKPENLYLNGQITFTSLL